MWQKICSVRLELYFAFNSLFENTKGTGKSIGLFCYRLSERHFVPLAMVHCNTLKLNWIFVYLWFFMNLNSHQSLAKIVTKNCYLISWWNDELKFSSLTQSISAIVFFFNTAFEWFEQLQSFLHSDWFYQSLNNIVNLCHSCLWCLPGTPFLPLHSELLIIDRKASIVWAPSSKIFNY